MKFKLTCLLFMIFLLTFKECRKLKRQGNNLSLKNKKNLGEGAFGEVNQYSFLGGNQSLAVKFSKEGNSLDKEIKLLIKACDVEEFYNVDFEGKSQTNNTQIKTFRTNDNLDEIYNEKTLSINKTVSINELVKEIDENQKACFATRIISYGRGNSPFIVMPMFSKSGATFYQEKLIDLTAKELYDFIIEIANSVTIMHEKGIYHHDLKFENILQDETTQKWYIADFGKACLKGETECLKETLGSPQNTPYEKVKLNKISKNQSHDYYSLGMLLVALVLPNEFKAKFDQTELIESLNNFTNWVTNNLRTDFKKLKWMSKKVKNNLFKLLMVLKKNSQFFLEEQFDNLHEFIKALKESNEYKYQKVIWPEQKSLFSSFFHK